MFRKILGKKKQVVSRRKPSGVADARAYAIGDIHGRLDLLRDLIDRIDADRRARPCARDYIVFLGDLIDRGPDSAGVIDFLLAERDRLPHPIFIMGNHEEMLLRILDGDVGQFRDWIQYGGYECAQSYGVEVGKLSALDDADGAALLRKAVPDAHRAFIRDFADSFQFGDYLFVHAGIRPGVAIREQKVEDLRWIRQGFLDSSANHRVIVVHGHTISDGPDEQANRIGIDTGAYTSGILTALCIDGTERTYLATR